MQPSFWLERWRQGQVGFHQAKINADLQQHWQTLGGATGSQVFVPLCGKSDDMTWLHAQGHSVLGVELAELAVRSFFEAQQLSPARQQIGRLARWQADGYELYVGDFFDLSAAQLSNVRAVYDRAALIALPPVLRLRYARHLAAILPAECKMLLITMDYPQEQMAGPPFSVLQPEVRELFSADFSVSLLDDRDTLAVELRLQQRGLRRLHEQTYLLQRNSVRPATVAPHWS